MKPFPKGLFLLLFLFTSIGQMQAQNIDLEWKAREDLNIMLPASVQIYEANGFLPDSSRIRAYYASIDLTDENLKLRAKGSNTVRMTTEDAYFKNDGILAINGGYFSNNASVSLLISDGKVISPGPVGEGIKGAFGLVAGKPQIVWSNAKKPNSPPLKYNRPNPGSNAEMWEANQAVGGGPVLLKNGVINVTSKEEGFGGSHLKRHPRTAIGYSDEQHLIMMVVDGRQKTSAGVTLPELAQLMKDVGAVEAINLDGGGSSAMVAADEVVNIPVDITGGDRNKLRHNASALILSQISKQEGKEVYLLDTDSHAYTEIGLWRTSNRPNYYGGTPSRIASSAHYYNKAIFDFDSIPTKKYQLAAWWTVNLKENAKKVTYVVHHGRETSRITLNQSDLSTNAKWNIIGNFVLGPNDYVEIIGTGKKGKITTDALRLVSVTNSPVVPVRGDLRIGVISDLNSGLGATNYEWQVDSIIKRIPRIWKPDLVLIAGDMVAGMGVSDSLQLKKMWKSFDTYIAEPLQKAGIPFAFTLGNHDGPRSYPKERKAAVTYWTNPENMPDLNFVDKTHYPNYYSFRQGNVFFVSWDASSADITEENLAWLKQQFKAQQAKTAEYRMLLGHIPLYSVAQERNSKGNVLASPEKIQKLLEKYKVHTYISGHQHAYYPGKRGGVQFLHSGAAGSGPRSWLTQELKPMNSITIMDVFNDRDTIVYSTYKIKEKQAENMKRFDEKKLPSAMFGVNGYVLRRDIALSKEAKGAFSAINAISESNETGKGSITAEISGDKLLVSGHFFSLKGNLIEKNPIALFKGRNTEQGKLLKVLKVTANKGALGMFNGTLTSNGNLKELLSVGALYATIRTDEGVLRTQFYPEYNSAPATPAITSHNERNVYAVRNNEALYEVNWTTSNDPDGDFVSYLYQLSTDRHFNNVVLEKKTGRVSALKMTEKEWFKLLRKADIGSPITFYHRVGATDGKNSVFSKTKELNLMKSNEPLYDLIEVQAPNYEFQGKIKNAEGGGYGALWDKEGKLWLADYRGKLIIKKEGSEATFSPLTSVKINQKTYDLNPITGIGLAADGNILLGQNRHLIKIDATTGKGIAVWEVPEGARAITAPRVNSEGKIYAMSLFGEDPNYVLKQSSTNPGTFKLVRTIELKNRILSRTFEMSSNGKTLYFPDPGSAVIQKYISKDGIHYIQAENITSTASGSSAIKIVNDGSLYAAVRASGISPSTFHYRNIKEQKMWTLELPELQGAEPRGIGVSPDQKTLIFCAWDKGGGFYKYKLKK